jgi:ABC-type uncharacterized transport system ATPase subunit
MIKQVKIKNYRSIVDADVRLEKLSVIVGANGSGKTNLIHALKQGMAGLWNTGKGEKHHDHPNVEHSIECTDTEGKVVTEGKCVNIYRLNQECIGGDMLGHLASACRKTEILDNMSTMLRGIFPGLKRIIAIPDERKYGLARLAICDHGDFLIPCDQAFTGAKKVTLIIAALCHEDECKTSEDGLLLSNGRTSMLCFENIDAGIHPGKFGALAEMLRSARYDRQVVVTTHNPYFLDHIKLPIDAVIVTEMVNGETRLSNVDYDSMKEELGVSTVGELWASGLIGGI